MTVWIIGATSDVGRATAERFAAAGNALLLLGRDETELAKLCDGISQRNSVEAAWQRFDVEDNVDAMSVVSEALRNTKTPDVVVVCLGASRLTSKKGPLDETEIRSMVRCNYEYIVSLLLPITQAMRSQGSGSVVAIGSICGDAGFKSKYLKAALASGAMSVEDGERALVYATAKSALHGFLDGLATASAPYGVRVVTIKPATLAVGHNAKEKGLFSKISPDTVAAAIVRASQGGPKQVYVKGFFRWILLALQFTPTALLTFLLRTLKK